MLLKGSLENCQGIRKLVWYRLQLSVTVVTKVAWTWTRRDVLVSDDWPQNPPLQVIVTTELMSVLSLRGKRCPQWYPNPLLTYRNTCFIFVNKPNTSRKLEAYHLPDRTHLGSSEPFFCFFNRDHSCNFTRLWRGTYLWVLMRYFDTGAEARIHPCFRFRPSSAVLLDRSEEREAVSTCAIMAWLGVQSLVLPTLGLMRHRTL